MLDALRFVATAVAKKDYIPELTHFKIKDGRVTGFNGVLALSSDIDVDLNIQPAAAKLLTAIRACSGVISLHMTAGGRLSVRSGKFKSFVDCLPDDAATFVQPVGETIELGEQFLPGIKAISPLMGIDASRPWSMGVKLQGQSMFATNNVMLAEYWHGTTLPIDVVIPAQAINELIRINECPSRVQIEPNSISFWFGDKRWLRTGLLQGDMWPIDRMSELLSQVEGEQIAIPEGFAEAVDTMKPFLGEHGSVYVTPNAMATSKNEGEGSSIDIVLPGIGEMQAYHHRQLELLTKVAKTIDWTTYPRPCMFRGERMRGALVGQKV
jgi:hypothetical protein